jgi:predicted MFS family arabinose efflux permease
MREMGKGTEDRRRRLALYVLCVGMLMIVLDATIVNVALPTIQKDLGFSQNDLAWVVNAYLIAFGGLLLPVVRPRVRASPCPPMRCRAAAASRPGCAS